MKNRTLIICIIALLSNACDSGNTNDECSLDPEKFYRSYINTYVDCKMENSMRVSVFTKKLDATTKIIGGCDNTWEIGKTDERIFSIADGIGIDIDGHYLDLERNRRDIYVFYDNAQYNSNYINKEDQLYYLDRKTGFEQYSTLIGDTCFNQLLRVYPYTRAIITPLQTITITANHDFSEELKTGCDLGSLFTVYFNDLYATVKNGYKSLEGTYSYVEGLPYPQSVRKAKLSEVNFPDYPFIGDMWRFFLNIAPEKTGEYVFHIKAIFIDGTVLEASAPPINIQGTLN